MMKIAVVGADSVEGREILNVMEAHSFPKEDIVALDNREFVGKEISYGEDAIVKVKALNDFDFKDVFVAVLAVPEAEAKKVAANIAAKGVWVVDTSGAFSLEPDVCLLAAGINDDSLTKYAKKKIVASPAVYSLLAASVLKPLDKEFGLVRASFTVMLGTAVLGKEAMDELFHQTKGIYMNENIMEHKVVYPKQIAFNVMPFVTDIDKYGFLPQEKTLAAEVEKIFGKEVKVNANVVTIPTFFGSCAYVNVQTEKNITVAGAVDALDGAENITVFNSTSPEGYATPVEVAGEDKIFLSRFKKDNSVPNGVNLFAAMETTRAGLAVNAVKVTEMLVDKFA